MKRRTLREARRRRGLTQVQLAALSRVLQTTISKLELGVIANPSYEVVARLEDALGVRRGTLIFCIEQQQPPAAIERSA